MPPKQPYDLYPNLEDADLRLAILNKTIAHRNLGVDASPGAYDLTPVNPTDIVTRSVGADFGGTNGYLREAGGKYADWRGGDSVGTILAWVKTTGINGVHQVILGSADEGSTSRYLRFAISSGGLCNIRQRNNDTADHVSGDTVLLNGQWYRIALVSNGSAYAIYVDGQAEGLTVTSGANAGHWLDVTDDRDNLASGALRTSAPVNYFYGEIKDLRYYSRVLSAGEIARDYALAIPDNDLTLWVPGTGWDGFDHTRYWRTLTPYGGVVVGHDMIFDGTDDYIDCGNIGNVQQVSMLLQIGSANEQVLRIDAGKHIAFTAGTIQYTGITPVATYVNGVPGGGTVLGTDRWYHLVAVFQQDAAANFELGWDGANYGQIRLRDVKARDAVWSASDVAEEYDRLKKYL